MKKAETQFVLYGTHQKLAKAKKINISLNGKMISQSESYEYLGATIDKCLTMNEHLDKTYKKVMSRTRLLPRIRHISPMCSRGDV